MNLFVDVALTVSVKVLVWPVLRLLVSIRFRNWLLAGYSVL